MNDIKLTMYDTNSCCVQEIAGLKNYSDPKKAMVKFCELNLEVDKPKYHGFPARNKALYSFYYFTARVLKEVGDINYGTEFADFILENGLGEVVASPIKRNKGWHEGHYNQMWIWHPHTDQLRTWWTENKPKTEPEPTTEPKVDPKSKVVEKKSGRWEKAAGGCRT